jgi:hypothetical protein
MIKILNRDSYSLQQDIALKTQEINKLQAKLLILAGNQNQAPPVK